MSTASDVINDIQGISLIGAGWYSAISGKPVIVPGTAEQIAAQYSAVSAQNQARTQSALLQNQPTVAGLLNNPTVIIFGVLAVILVFFLLLRR